MYIDFSTGCLMGYDLPRVFRIAKEAGADGLELVMGNRMREGSAPYLNSLSDSYGIPIYSVHAPMSMFSHNHFPSEVYENVVRLALSLRAARAVVFHFPKIANLDDHPGPQFLETLRKCAGMVAGSQCRITVENPSLASTGGKVTHIMDRMPELRRLADREELAITFDTSHAGTTGVDLLQSFEVVESRVENIHFSDMKSFPLPLKITLLHSAIREHQRPGSGSLPLRALLQRLAVRRYDGLVTLELSPFAIQTWNESRAELALARAISFCRSAG